MSKNSKEPVTPAVRVLSAAGIGFEGHPYDYIIALDTSDALGLLRPTLVSVAQ